MWYLLEDLNLEKFNPNYFKLVDKKAIEHGMINFIWFPPECFLSRLRGDICVILDATLHRIFSLIRIAWRTFGMD